MGKMLYFAKYVEGGEEIHATCYHCYHNDENEGAFYIDVDTGLFLCFRCEWKGNIYKSLTDDERIFYTQLFEEFGIDFAIRKDIDSFLSMAPSFLKYIIKRKNKKVSETYEKIIASTIFLDKSFLKSYVKSALMYRLRDFNYNVSDLFVDRIYSIVKKFSHAVIYNYPAILFEGANVYQLYFFVPESKLKYQTFKKYDNVSSVIVPRVSLSMEPVILVEGVWDMIALKYYYTYIEPKPVDIYAVLGFSNFLKVIRRFKYTLTKVVPDFDKIDDFSKVGSKYIHDFTYKLTKDLKDPWDWLVNEYKEHVFELNGKKEGASA